MNWDSIADESREEEFAATRKYRGLSLAKRKNSSFQGEEITFAGVCFMDSIGEPLSTSFCNYDFSIRCLLMGRLFFPSFLQVL